MGVECVHTGKDLKRALGAITASPHFTSLGFVPTMGALHKGHASLIERACGENSHVVVSIFVNPKQFGPKEDFSHYPRTLERDVELIANTGAHLVFAPGVEDVYPTGFSTTIQVEGLTKTLCGANRPGHFNGVCTVVAKLLHMVAPQNAYFGLKDYQQVAVIGRMVTDLSLPTTIHPCPIHRDPDGLAASSRNAYLSPAVRRQVVALPRALFAGAHLYFEEGKRQALDILSRVQQTLEAGLGPWEWEVDYLGVYDPHSLEPLHGAFQEALLALAVRVPGSPGQPMVRLIDNIRLMAQGQGDFLYLGSMLEPQ